MQKSSWSKPIWQAPVNRPFEYGAQRRGKSEMMRIIAEAYLDAGRTVAFVKADGTCEVRGARPAKDVTPPKPRQIEGTR